MGPDLINLINSLYAHALNVGLSYTFPIKIIYGDDNFTNGEDVSIIVSATEPTEQTFLNIFWLVADENSADYLNMFVRISKDAFNGKANTWQQILSVDSLGVEQYYDAQDVIRTSLDTQISTHTNAKLPHPNFKVIDENGGTLKDKLFIRSITNSQGYDLTEAIPRRTLVDALNSQTSGFYAILQNLNNRVNINATEINLLKSRVGTLESGGSGGTGTAYFVHTQTAPLNEWIINHNLNSTNLLVNVWLERIDPGTGNPILYEAIPEEKIIFDANFILIQFVNSVVGKVIITAV